MKHPSGLIIGTTTITTALRRAAASGWEEVTKSRKPFVTQDAGVSPGCTLAETKTTRRTPSARGGSPGRWGPLPLGSSERLKSQLGRLGSGEL
eukprot:CAMPEP_0182874810 /NCGR_PEP_ID=MMETSP0034_2-20130328/13164_1 /TAXON_ID=156128 /ORGANISM="Nephroselmis pyriformis, Strain CCMP717" /LENGTH=92 /DNA_ID=CAMNT_0025007537 /DNA_START=526 /DNA_END=804 /DNA_ORIENTATION=-